MTKPCKAEFEDIPMTVEQTRPNGGDLDRGSGAALWRQIADILQAEIVADTLANADGRLPPERELTARFGVNRHTVRQALGDLAERGIVRAEQGRGVFVNTELLAYPLGRRVRFTENLTAQQIAPRGEIIEIVEDVAERDVATALALKAGAPVWRVERLGLAEDRRISIASHFFSRRAFPRLKAAFENETSITRVLENYGVPNYERRETRVTARPATAEETRLLELPRGRPVLVTEGVNIAPDGKPVEYSVARFAADRVQLLA